MINNCIIIICKVVHNKSNIWFIRLVILVKYWCVDSQSLSVAGNVPRHTPQTLAVAVHRCPAAGALRRARLSPSTADRRAQQRSQTHRCFPHKHHSCFLEFCLSTQIPSVAPKSFIPGKRVGATRSRRKKFSWRSENLGDGNTCNLLRLEPFPGSFAKSQFNSDPFPFGSV